MQLVGRMGVQDNSILFLIQLLNNMSLCANRLASILKTETMLRHKDTAKLVFNITLMDSH